MAPVVGLEGERFETEQCLEWTTGEISGRRPYVSPTFTFQGSKSHFMLCLRCPYTRTPFDYFLYICGTQRLYLPFDVTVQVIKGEHTHCWPRKTMKEQHEYLWMCSKTQLSQCMPGNQEVECLRFRVILHTRSSGVNTESTSVQTPSYFISSPCLESLSRDFGDLMVDPRQSPFDIKLKCGDHTFRVHRTVICARSKVLADMVKTDLEEECETSSLTVPVVNVGIFRSFLKYLYDGTASDLTLDSAVQLYEVGQMYEVRGLVGLCSSFFVDHMARETACGFLALADDHGDSDLKEKAIGFILENRIFLCDDEWLPFCDSHPSAALEIFNLHIRNNRERYNGLFAEN